MISPHGPRPRPKVLLLTLALALIGGSTAQAAGDGPFPLSLKLGQHYLEDADGRPFFMHGDTAWSLIADLALEDAEQYLRDRQQRGFNTVLVNLIEHKFARNAPANAYGQQPFLVDDDFAAPNPAYFDHAERVLRLAEELDILVLLAPAYAGNQGGEEGWYAAMQRSGVEKLLAYGRYLGRRFGDLENIVWVHGGDYDPPDKDLVRAVVDGIREHDPDALHTAHGAPGNAAFHHWAGEPWLALNNVYTYGPTHSAAREERLRGAGTPFFLLESAYENEHDADDYRMRMQAYQAVLSGAMGHVYGNNPIWHFEGPGIYPVPFTWQEQLDSPGARSMGVLAHVFASIDWWLLEPDEENVLLLDGAGRETARSVAARAADGSFAIVYAATSWPITIDLGQLSGPMVEARWRDPSTGQVEPVAGSPLLPDVLTLRPARRHFFGANDWLLELKSAPVPGATHDS